VLKSVAWTVKKLVVSRVAGSESLRVASRVGS
jgi:hypothetical protein